MNKELYEHGDELIDGEGNKWLMFHGQWIPIIDPDEDTTKIPLQ